MEEFLHCFCENIRSLSPLAFNFSHIHVLNCNIFGVSASSVKLPIECPSRNSAMALKSPASIIRSRASSERLSTLGMTPNDVSREFLVSTADLGESIGACSLKSAFANSDAASVRLIELLN